MPVEQVDTQPRCELSIVMPCLNEAETLAACIEKARRRLAGAGVAGEIVIAGIRLISASFFLSVLGLRTGSRTPSASS